MNVVFVVLLLALSAPVFSNDEPRSCSIPSEEKKLAFLSKEITSNFREVTRLMEKMGVIEEHNLVSKPNKDYERQVERTFSEVNPLYEALVSVSATHVLTQRSFSLEYLERKNEEFQKLYDFAQKTEFDHLDSFSNAVGIMLINFSLEAYHQHHYFIVKKRMEFAKQKEVFFQALYRKIRMRCEEDSRSLEAQARPEQINYDIPVHQNQDLPMGDQSH